MPSEKKSKGRASSAVRTARTAPKKPGSKKTVEAGAGLDREVAIARKAALAAGSILLRYYLRGSYKVGSKGYDNPVTTADLQADRTVKRMLTRAFPDYGWLSEETADTDDRLTRRRVWIVDPLDGTKEFIKGIPEFCVAIALVDRGVPILGITYNPVKDEMFWSARGMGCHLNNGPARVTRTRVLKRAKVLASRSETARGEWEVYHGVLMFSPTGSVAYKLALVAGGKADATFSRTPKNEWDIAAGAALVTEAGGMMTDIKGRAMRFNQKRTVRSGMIASNGLLHEALVKAASIQTNGG
jgi:myo-inositol-1(or 4)-monophosphatase